MQAAWSAVAAGIYDVVLVAGVEKMTSQSTPRVAEILAGAGDLRGEVRAGATFPALFGMIARRHMYAYGTTREHLAAVAVKNHANGVLNPEAHLRKAVTMEQAAARSGKVVYIDTWQRFTGRDGGYAEYVVDPRDGMVKPVRQGDGFHLNVTGAEILSLDIAAAVEAALTARGATF